MATRDISDLQVVQAYALAKMARAELPPSAAPERYVWPYDLLAAWTSQPHKVCYAAMERAERRGLVDCGVSLRSGWLTPKGEAMLTPSKAVVDVSATPSQG